ncbi:hypothetical protein LX15_005353 [Streptoalloteichus tenebrarius]|uniref:Uncharacterized protein n=1 Tax=Streptoalloteichus tenebrarius (strain ATCC 17920 / DSM 40477 / JCM 4838 / CBS 697.72 / NBRC 16177 / NCIMB 11028 / NRRL B-12390 / A12253. 1 / ISP 5477) TaxID=1933 RepID=A0ABT1I1F3_STRSD|nr:hypothetical protein [Streptoalloteichus tenebrarius]MCP2261627.1 hypothetical protein [Streptoalloteichus tenebrarius]BFE99371.1 hypothetical protein GCM10020241_10470 [Streptoalloteichus tenebrarius]
MRRIRSSLLAAVACLATLALISPSAGAEQPALHDNLKTAPAEHTLHAQERAASIVPGVRYYLELNQDPTRGVTFEPYMNWDYVLLTNSAGAHGTPVIFHQRGGGYVVQSTSANWGGYTYWQDVGNGVRLAPEGEATVFTVRSGSHGFLLESHGNYATYPVGGKGWLQFYASVLPNFREFAYWRVVQA